MSQDQVSGAAANQWGRTTAREIAEKIGASMVSNSSNECTFENVQAVIKCAKPDTDSVGVTYNMLKRLDVVIGAFQTEKDNFEIYILSKQYFEVNMRPTASQGSAKGKVGILRKSGFESNGVYFGSVNI